MTNHLPPGWTSVKLGEILTPRKGKHTPSPSDQRPYLSLDNIESHTSRISAWERSSDYSSQSSRLFAGDVAYARLRPYLNKAAVIDREALGSAEFIVLSRTAEILPSFLCYRLIGHDFVRFADQHSTGDRPRLKWLQMRDFAIWLPPLSEQERIVAAIEEHFTRLNTVEDSLIATQSKVRDLRAVLAKRATRDWPTAELGDLADVFVGSTPSRKKPELWGGPVPWVSSGEVQFCRIRDTRESVATTAVRPDRIHPPGTVLLGMIGEGRTRGQAAVLEIAATHNQNSAAIRTQPSRLDPNWLFQVFSAQYESNRRVGSGNNQPALNKARVQGLRIPLPPLGEQRRLVEQLDEAAAGLDQLSSGLEGALQRCAALRRAVLSEAFAGQLVPQDPNDEPASVLLERIAASRSTKPNRRASARQLS